jgi:hypothetical protein
MAIITGSTGNGCPLALIAVTFPIIFLDINNCKISYYKSPVSSKNYEFFQSLGKTGMTFNEVIDSVVPLIKNAKT